MQINLFGRDTLVISDVAMVKEVFSSKVRDFEFRYVNPVIDIVSGNK